jgi:hypothetical protein
MATTEDYNHFPIIQEGKFIDVSNLAKLIGIKETVLITKDVWQYHIIWDDTANEKPVYQDTESRLWNILIMLSWCLRKPDVTDLIFFEVHMVPNTGLSYIALETKLKAVITTDNNLNSVITVMMHDEE